MSLHKQHTCLKVKGTVFNLPNHSKHMAIYKFSLQQANTEYSKNLEQKFIYQISTLHPHRIDEHFSFN